MAFHKGQTPWNKGKKGLQKCTDVAKEKHRLSAIKNGLGKVNHVAWNKGTKGICKAWNKGLKGFLGGEKHYNWQGGKSSEAYGLEFNDDLKEVIRNRDRRKCYLCEKTELENGEKLSVHHIDYEKTNMAQHFTVDAVGLRKTAFRIGVFPELPAVVEQDAS